MLLFRTWRGELTDDSLPGDAVERLLEAPLEGLSPVLGPTRELHAELLGLKAEDLAVDVITDRPRREQIHYPELFAGSSGFALIYARRLGRVVLTGSGAEQILREGPGRWRIFVHVLSRSADLSWANPLLHAASSAYGIELDSPTPSSQRFSELRDEGRASPDPVTPDERESARVLADRDARRLAIAIKAGGGLLVGDLEKQLPESSRGRVDELRHKLEDVGLVENEIVVVCNKSQAQTLRVRNRAALEDVATNGFRCGCGRAILDERVAEALSISELGRQLLDASRWFSLILTDELASLGVSSDRILLEQDMGGDELDCLADVQGELVFFELKDKEFSLGNAYSFGAKIGIVRPDESVIVTSEYVGNDAKEHFERAQMAEQRERRYRPPETTKGVQYIEGLENMASGLQALVTEIGARRALRLLGDVMPTTVVPASVLVRAVASPS